MSIYICLYSHQFLCFWDEQIMSADVGCCLKRFKGDYDEVKMEQRRSEGLKKKIQKINFALTWFRSLNLLLIL